MSRPARHKTASAINQIDSSTGHDKHGRLTFPGGLEEPHLSRISSTNPQTAGITQRLIPAEHALFSLILELANKVPEPRQVHRRPNRHPLTAADVARLLEIYGPMFELAHHHPPRTVNEIAAAINYSRWTVQRALKRPSRDRSHITAPESPSMPERSG